MQIPGHLALGLAQHRLPTLSTKKALLPLLLASMFPDLVDKTVGYVFRLMPNGRHYAHNLFSLTGTSTFVAIFWGRHTGYAWFMGYLGHLLADTNGLVPWFFPVQSYHFQKGRLLFDRGQLIRESMLLLLAIVFHRLTRQNFLRN